MMRIKTIKIFNICAVLLMVVFVRSTCLAASSSIEVLDAISACALGSKSTLTNETKGTIRRQLDGNTESGRATDELVPKIADTILAEAVNKHNYELYDKYVACLKDLLGKKGLGKNEIEEFIPNKSRANYYMEADKFLRERKYHEAIQPLEMASKLGDSDAELSLGIIYSSGLAGVPYKPDQAFKLFKSSADQGNTLALGRVSLCYYKGIGTKIDVTKAISYAKEGLIHKEPFSIYLIGDFYKNGIGEYKQDDCKAFSYFKQSSELGSAQGHISLAIMYIGGYCTVKDYKLAHDLLTKASNSGNPDAVEGIKIMRDRGLYIDEN